MNKDIKPEVLAPAGSTESIYAAVRCGADGIYVGGKDFSARANAVNFSEDELSEAVRFCHLHGVKIYRAMNTVIFDSELEHFRQELIRSAEMGIDGVIIQDLGGAYIAAQTVKDMPRHASTQMTIHTPLGALAAEKLGFCRIVPARELSLEQIRAVCETGVETEVFVHGAQCMCLSGQCYMSALIGSRSANRGQCAQACRLPFSADDRISAESYALSLKDMSLCRHVNELSSAGCASFKIEGRMKRPEYVAAAVTAMKNAVEGKDSLSEDMRVLEAVFSRSGFTDGYLTKKIGREMFGFRRKEDVTAANDVLPQLSAMYRSERKSGTMDMHFQAHEGSPAVLEFTADGMSGRIEGRCPEAARNRSITCEDITKQLSKLGDTRYIAGSISCDISEGIMLPAAEINRMRREAAETADRMTVEKNTPQYDISREPLPELYAPKYSGSRQIRVRLKKAETAMRITQSVSMFILPLRECEDMTDTELIKRTAVSLPVFVNDEKRLMSRLEALYMKGFTHYYCENFTHLGVLSRMKDTCIHGGTGLNIANSRSLEVCRQLGLTDTELSFELKAVQISRLKAAVPVGIFAYGRLPLMTVRNCPVKAAVGCGKCTGRLTDRTGRCFPVSCDEKEYAQIYNSDILETSDKLSDFSGISFITLDIGDADSTAADCIISRYINGGKPEGAFTRGLYYRGVI